MAAYDVVDVTTGGWWNLQHQFQRGENQHNSNVGNVRYFLATFKDTVAILSDSPTSEIKRFWEIVHAIRNGRPTYEIRLDVKFPKL